MRSGLPATGQRGARRARHVMGALAALVCLVACSGDDDTGEPAAESGVVTDLLAERPAGEITVEGSLFSDSRDEVELCDRIGTAPGFPDVPPEACLGNAVGVDSDVDLFSLDLPWSDGGQGLVLRGVTLTGTFDGEVFRLTSLSVDDDVVVGG